MKKTLLACLAVAALLAIASPAFAITCTVDQRPAATLLVPYFQVSYDADGNLVTGGPDSRDTIFTIANASAAPMVAHVDIWTRESQVVLDFDVALSGFDVQAMRVSDILSGFLPVTGVHDSGEDVCQRNGGAVYPNPDGFLRVFPLVPTSGADNLQATTTYSVPAFNFDLASELRLNCNGDLDDLAIGYITIDHVNYCNLSNPTDSAYYYNDAIGMENNLWGEIIFTSGEGLPTYAMSTVNVETDTAFGIAAENLPDVPVRTFYARYWDPFVDSDPLACPNCGSGDPDTDLLISAPWDVGFGDQREPLGLRWAARWFELAGSITTNFRVWRSSPAGGDCIVPEPQVALIFFDEDEHPTAINGCPSPCGNTAVNFDLETQQRNILDFAVPGGAAAGWVQMDFANAATVYDQAWADYSFEGTLAFESILVPGTQLDPSSCNPLGFTDGVDDQIIAPAISNVNIPAGTGI